MGNEHEPKHKKISNENLVGNFDFIHSFENAFLLIFFDAIHEMVEPLD